MKNLKKLRKKAGLTTEQIARMMGVAQSTVGRWESEEDRYPAGKELPKLADILRCKVSDFYA
jgi:transcriptional regulator with XRE-family HTH domain